MKKSEFMLHAAMFDQRLLDKTCTVVVVTLLYGCHISVLSALSLDFIKYKLKRSNEDSFHHHLAYLPNRKLYPNIRCRCGLDTVLLLWQDETLVFQNRTWAILGRKMFYIECMFGIGFYIIYRLHVIYSDKVLFSMFINVKYLL